MGLLCDMRTHSELGDGAHLGTQTFLGLKLTVRHMRVGHYNSKQLWVLLPQVAIGSARPS